MKAFPPRLVISLNIRTFLCQCQESLLPSHSLLSQVRFSIPDILNRTILFTVFSHHSLILFLSELTLGPVIGEGGFSKVYEIQNIELDPVYDVSDEDTKRRQDFATKVKQNNYVLKKLRDDLREDDHSKGVDDLAIEADVLRQLSHQSILCIRATANTDPTGNGFFIVLDRLVQTLDRKFNYWRKVVGENAGYWFPCYGYCCARSHTLHALWKERIQVALDIAQAISYIHDQKIIYRDLKPDNCGFDHTQQVKLYDFGLAKRISEHDAVGDGTYRLTGNTGSLRYMAPEVAKNIPYNYTADAYSFGVLFWQICSLQTPYAKFTENMHTRLVVDGGMRPKPDKTWPASWVTLMHECWNDDKTKRPPFSLIIEQLSERLKELREDDGVVPTRTHEIKAKKKKKKVSELNHGLDTDTRLAPQESNIV